MVFQIPKVARLENRIFGIKDQEAFKKAALHVFYFQYANNPLYKRYCQLINCLPQSVTSIEKIPFLPISFFKTHAVQTTPFSPEIIFESSGTTGSVNSKHLVKNTALYQQSFLKCFELFYGDVSEYCFLALLPSYLQKGASSLIYMVNGLMEKSNHPLNNFYLHDYKALAQTITDLEKREQKTALIGVTYALLDFAELFPRPLQHTIIMETGGMKGRRQELIRSEVHRQLTSAFGVSTIHSEYGMTELLSQAYAKEEGRFTTPPWMKVLLREEDDHKKVAATTTKAVSGGLNVIDFANLYSCSFIATEDVGRLYADGSFEVLGRMDNTDIRGCSLLSL